MNLDENQAKVWAEVNEELDLLLSNMDNKEMLAAYITANIIKIEEKTFWMPRISVNTEYIKMPGSFSSGGETIKVKNILINWRNLFFDDIPGTITAVVGAVAAHWTIPITVISIWRKLQKQSTIKLSENHCITITSLWSMRIGDTNRVNGKNLLVEVNKKFIAYQRNPLLKQELDAIIDDLQKYKTLDLNPDGTISLIEEIRIA